MSLLHEPHYSETERQSVSNSMDIPAISNLTIKLVYLVPVSMSDEKIPNDDREAALEAWKPVFTDLNRAREIPVSKSEGHILDVDREAAIEAWKPILTDLTRARESTENESRNLGIKPRNPVFNLPFLAEIASNIAILDHDEMDLPCSDSSSVPATQKGSSKSLEINENNPDDNNEGALITSLHLSRQRSLLKPPPPPSRRTRARSDTKPREKEDCISDFNKRYPKMPSVEMIEKEIAMSSETSNLPVIQAPKPFGFNPHNPFFKHLNMSVKEKYHSETAREGSNEKESVEQTALWNSLRLSPRQGLLNEIQDRGSVKEAAKAFESHSPPRQGLLNEIRARGAAKETAEALKSHLPLHQRLLNEIRARGAIRETVETLDAHPRKASFDPFGSARSECPVKAESESSMDKKESKTDSSKPNPVVPNSPLAQETAKKVDPGTFSIHCFAQSVETIAKDELDTNSDYEEKNEAPLGNGLGTAARQKLFDRLNYRQVCKPARTKYQFEADGEDDEDETSPDTSFGNAAPRLQELAKAVEINTFADACFFRHTPVQKYDKVDEQIAMNRARLERIC